MARGKYLAPTLGVAQGGAIIASRLVSDADLGTRFYVLGLALGAFTTVVGSLYGWKYEREKQELEGRVVLHAAHDSIRDLNVVASRDIGLHAFQLKSTMRHPRRGEHLRVARLRPNGSIPKSCVRWTGDMGVIGATKEQASIIMWWRLADSPLQRLVGCTEADWNATDKGELMGLSFQDWRIVQRYKGVIAAPIVVAESGTNPRYAGCVTLDCTTDDAYLRLHEQEKKVDEILQNAANSFSKLLVM